MTQLPLSWTGYKDTSRRAWNELQPKLGDRQSQVLNLLKNGLPMTNMEIATALGWSINRVTPRTGELVLKNLVADLGQRPCRVTGRLAHIWGIRNG